MKKVYLILSIIGTIVPYYFLIQFLKVSGFDFILMLELLFANDISAFFAIDFLISSVVFIVFMFKEAKNIGMKKFQQYICLVTLFTVGLSLAFPLFLFFRVDYFNCRSRII